MDSVVETDRTARAAVDALAMSATAQVSLGRDSTTKPYKGLNSFQVEDVDLFYGRDREAEQLVAKILSSRLTILHAQSGAGKTSLLNARVIPGLEALGWSAVRAIPQTDPVRSVITTTLLHVLAPPEAERLAIESAWELLNAPTSLGDLLKRFDRLEQKDPVRRGLIGPVRLRPGLSWAPHELHIYPWFNRLLRSTTQVDQFAAHLDAFRTLAGLPASGPIDANTPVADVVQLLTELHGSYADVLESFSPRDRSFERFFDSLVARYGVLMPQSAIVVLFDQAEELFTRFVDHPGHRHHTLDWRLKWEFFDQLEHLIGRPAIGHTAAAGVPIRFVVSLRSEYIAQLDPIRTFAWDLDSCSYHLGMLGKVEAMSAITEPADRFGYAYTDACYSTIVGQLAREERYVEPAQLQIVCDKLWQVHGYILAATEVGREGENKPVITIATLERLGGTQGILGSFLEEMLGRLDPEDRLEALEILETLVTPGGTRNVVNRDDLVHQHFRNVERRERLVKRLVSGRILREEQRLGGLFCEITHEFLIAPILTAVKELAQNVEYSRFRWAVGTLQQLAGTGRHARDVGTLRISEFLATHDNRARLVLDNWLREVMLRSALALAHTIPEYRQPDEIVAFWIGELDAHAAPRAGLVQILELLERPGYVVGREELVLLNADRRIVTLTSAQKYGMLRAELARSIDAERDDVEYWTRTVVSDEQSGV